MSWATPGELHESKKVKVSSGGGRSSLTSRTDANITSTVVSFAANATDAWGKEENCIAILDRTQMWNCTAVKGSSSSFEFVGLRDSKISMRSLPCPCQSCFDNNFDACTNLAFTEEKVTQELTLVEIVCPQFLTMPLDTITNPVLEAFLKMHGVKLPKSKKKSELIKTIMDTLEQYVINHDLIIE
jgi:hypothetical protein